jgi:hypothetical protein
MPHAQLLGQAGAFLHKVQEADVVCLNAGQRRQPLLLCQACRYQVRAVSKQSASSQTEGSAAA